MYNILYNIFIYSSPAYKMFLDNSVLKLISYSGPSFHCAKVVVYHRYTNVFCGP